jgi:mono/diheme cytochrome c family protein
MLATAVEVAAVAAGALPASANITPPQDLFNALAAAETGQAGNDITRDKLLDVQAWMRSITSPAPVAHDAAKPELGFELFNGKAGCSGCHSTPDLTGPGLFNAISHPGGGLAGGIKVPTLRGVAHTAPYLSNGSEPILPVAVEGVLGVLRSLNPAMPTFSAAEKEALVGYLKSL